MSQNAEFIQKVTPTPASGRGWRDFVEGRGFPAEYDGWDQIEQRHYERGRLRAAGWPLLGRGRAPRDEPWNIVALTNGLRLVPRDAGKRRRR